LQSVGQSQSAVFSVTLSSQATVNNRQPISAG
jgi:hypothetical protein